MPNSLSQYFRPDPCDACFSKARPLKTGQTVQYHVGDDGDLEKGIARSYSILTTGQYSGTTNITVNGKTIAMENMCSIDNRALKMWMSRTPDSDIGPDNNGKLLWEDAVNGEDIFAFCDAMNAANFGGHSDWRVSNYKELIDLVDLGRYNPTIDITAFPSTPSDYFWVASTRPDYTTHAFNVNFNVGNVGNYPKATNKYYVRLVRDV